MTGEALTPGLADVRLLRVQRSRPTIFINTQCPADKTDHDTAGFDKLFIKGKRRRFLISAAEFLRSIAMLLGSLYTAPLLFFLHLHRPQSSGQLQNYEIKTTDNQHAPAGMSRWGSAVCARFMGAARRASLSQLIAGHAQWTIRRARDSLAKPAQNGAGICGKNLPVKRTRQVIRNHEVNRVRAV